MVRAKAPLAERDANATPAKASGSKKSPKSASKDDSKEYPSLYDVANKITQTHSRKRAREDDDDKDDGASKARQFAKDAEEAHRQAEKAANAVKEKTPPIPDTLKWHCDQIRTKINALIRSGEVKVGEFQDELGVSSRSFNDFLQKSGPDKGRFNNTYEAAHDYFYRRELKGIPPPKAKKAKTDKASKDKDEEKYNVDDIKLDGEEKESVAIYDTASDIRTKINAHLRVPGKTQAGFAREIGKTYQTAGSNTNVTGAQVRRFLEKNGPTGGADSPVFYAAYVYFEKIRIKQKKPKSKKRQEMESEHKRQGMERRTIDRVWAMAGEVPHVNKYGKLEL